MTDDRKTPQDELRGSAYQSGFISRSRAKEADDDDGEGSWPIG